MMLAVGVLAASCVKEDGTIPDASADKGTLKVLDIKLSEAAQMTDQTRVSGAASGFAVTVADAGGQKVIECLASNLPAENELAEGSYTITVESHTPADAEWGKPYYFASKSFTIKRNETTTISEIVCDLANIMVTVEFTENMMKFISADSKAVIRIGSGELTYKRGTEVMVESQNTAYACAGSAGYFKAPAAENTLIWEFDGMIDGLSREISNVINKVKAGQHRKLKFDIERGSGDAEFEFTVSVECETVDLNHNIVIAEEVIYESVVFSSDYGFDKRHTLRRSEVLDGDDRPVVELGLNVSADKGIASFVVEVTSDNDEFNTVLAEAGFSAPFDLASPGELAEMLAMLGLPTGNAVAGKTSVDVDFAGFLPLAFGFGSIRTLDIHMTVTDTDGIAAAQTFKLRLTDDIAGSGITIEWVGRDIDQRQTFVKSEVIIPDDDIIWGVCTVPVVVDITVPNGISKFEVTIISNILGLDKESLNGLNLDDKFDLVSPHYINEPGDLEAALKGLEFPLGDEVKDQTYLQFDITNFIPLIFILGQDGTADFQLEITDNLGNTETKTIQLDIVQ